jgi:hypothetical protein
MRFFIQFTDTDYRTTYDLIYRPGTHLEIGFVVP